MKRPDDRPDIQPPAQVAGGLPAVLNSLRHVVNEAGLVKGSYELSKLNQMKGFDCPGCAWPDPDDRRELTEFCENGAKAVSEEATSRRVDPAFFAAHPVAELEGWSDFELGKAGRLTEPMVLDAGATHYRPASWDEALELIATELRGLASPDEAIFYTSGRTSNEAAFVYQLLVRLFGTNNLPDCSNMCHESSGVALKESLGVGKGSVTLEDFDRADCILIIGQNPGTNHPRMLTALQKAAKNGAKIISLNPLHETGLKAFKHPQKFWTWFGRGTPLEALHLPVRVNGDIAALKGLMKELLAAEDAAPGTVLAADFIAAHTHGAPEFLAALRAVSWEELVFQSGLSREHLAAAAQLIGKSKAMIACWAMGLTQQTQGVECIQEVVNLMLLGGHLGRAGAGVCPVRGHSNVQGDRTMGIYEKPAPAFLDALSREFHFEPPRRSGLDTVEAIHAMQDGRAHVFFAMGGNFAAATPDSEYTLRALRKTRLTVHVSTKLNRSHVVHGARAVILPCLGRTEVDRQASGEQLVSVENSMGVIHQSRGNLTPGSPSLRSEVSVVCGVARRLFHGTAKERAVDWTRLEGEYDRIREHIERVVPGFERYNERVRRPGGFYLPHPVRDHLRFDTPSGKAEFINVPLLPLTLPDGALVLMTVRSHDQFNTTIYGLDDRYRGVLNGRRVIFLNAQDLAERGLEEGQWVDITSHFEGQTRTAERFMVVTFEIPPRCAAAYFPETNVLVPIRSVVGRSNTPTYKSIIVTLAPSAPA